MRTPDYEGSILKPDRGLAALGALVLACAAACAGGEIYQDQKDIAAAMQTLDGTDDGAPDSITE